MLEIGDEFKINGTVGLVCFKGNYYGQDYVCLSFEDEGKFTIYKVKYDDNRFFFAEEKDQERAAYVLSQFITDHIGMDDELDSLFDSVIDDKQ